MPTSCLSSPKPLSLLYNPQQGPQQPCAFSQLLHQDKERRYCILGVFLAS